MKKIFNLRVYNLSMILAFLLIGVTGCNKEEDELSLKRQFTPASIGRINAETQVTLMWAASLFTLEGEVTYTVEVSDNATDFSTPVYTTTTTDVSIIITDNDLVIKKDYYARVKAQGKDKTADSNWIVSDSFRILGEQFLNAVTSDNVIDNAVRLTWRSSNELTNIVLTADGEDPIEVNLTAGDLTAMLKQIDDLTPGTTYTAEIFAGTKSKGTVEFTTASSVVGNIIDLRGISKPSILADTLADIASGSIVLLKRGYSYTISASYSFDKSMTIQSGLDFGTELAKLNLTTNFNVVANSVIDSIVFKDLVIKGARAALGSYNSDYILNANQAATISKIRLENCTIKILRGVVRAQTGGTGTLIVNYFVNNCAIDSIREYGIATASSTSAFANIKITNTTTYRMRRFITHEVTGNSSITIENCTFNEIVAGGAAVANYIISLNTQNSTNGISIKNCIFGKVWDETAAGTMMGGIRVGASTSVNVTNTYNTSDFATAANSISGLSSYSGAAASLFTNPDIGNFKIKDGNFIGKSSAGDPRWRP